MFNTDEHPALWLLPSVPEEKDWEPLPASGRKCLEAIMKDTLATHWPNTEEMALASKTTV